jgi:hypothetical protein
VGVVQTFATVDQVLARLRLPASHPDAAYVADATAEANELVSAWLSIGDLREPLAPVPVGVVNATVGVAMRVYRFKDAASDVSEQWGDLGPAPSMPRDPLAGYYDRLAPYRPGAAWAPGTIPSQPAPPALAARRVVPGA